MASIRSAVRYTNSLNSSTKSDPSSSTEFNSSRSLTKKNECNRIDFGSMVKKLMDGKKSSNSRKDPKFVVAADFLVEDMKKNVKKGSGLTGLHRKLFKGSTGSSGGAKRGEESTKKALIEVKGNTRTLAMVLRSERELLTANKEQEQQIAELKLIIEQKNVEVEKLKDLCLKQREEIKSLKSAVLFPDVTDSHLQVLVEKQGSELKQAKQLIPDLQKQVSSLTGQLQCLAEDLAEMKADKLSGRGSHNSHFSTPRMQSYDQEDGANSLFDQFSSGDYTTPDSPDDMLIKDLNPCLTPDKLKSRKFEGYESSEDERTHRSINQISPYSSIHSCEAKFSRSANSFQSSRAGKSVACRSHESKCLHGK